ncbi:hypothetical protein [Diaphorobacter sp.]
MAINLTTAELDILAAKQLQAAPGLAGQLHAAQQPHQLEIGVQAVA